MAVPFRRTGKTRKNLRRTHFKLDKPTLIECKECGAKIPPHTVCDVCGSYKGKKIIKEATTSASK